MTDRDMEDAASTEEEEEDVSMELKESGGMETEGGLPTTGDESAESGEEMKEEETAEETADEDEDEASTADEEEEEEEDQDARGRKEEEEIMAKVDPSNPASMRRMLQHLPPEEARRHEVFRRSHFDRGAIKRIMARAIQDCSHASQDKRSPNVTQVMAIVMTGMAKVFVQELTTEGEFFYSGNHVHRGLINYSLTLVLPLLARRIMERNGETGPICPRHLREARRKYYQRRPLARGRPHCRLLR